MGKAERERGKRGEREWAAYLRDVGGFDGARRGVQYSGLGGAMDVCCPELDESFWCEVKRVQKLSLESWMQTATESASGNQIAYIAHRKDGCRWRVTVDGEDFLKLMRAYVGNA